MHQWPPILAKVQPHQRVQDSLMLLIGSLIIATALEKWNLHRRIALKVLLTIGPTPRWSVPDTI
ncbi:Slc13a3 [Cordylochernes scorpioides]|uniref:Slc13a3 n=1 Tax=Cordylochernes scorpioides TaxID=51811 RepID=A0ABY6LLE6_9ARAC|nr:Slc13a3 [Cordylochernes scorpioides]